MVTIHDVARLAGVSIATVSNVLNKVDKVKPETIQRVMTAVRELNYVPNTVAKNLKTNKSNTIGVLVEDICAFQSGGIIQGLCRECDLHGFTVSLANLSVGSFINHTSPTTYNALSENKHFIQNVTDSVNTLLSARICALVYIGAHPRNIKGILPQLDVPVIYVYSYTDSNDFCINYDDFHGSEVVMNYLINSGHRNIALICGPLDSVPAQKRLSAYKAAHEKHAIPIRNDYIRKGDWGFDYAYKECLELLKLPQPPDAIFAMNDYMAFGAIKAITDSGLTVPGDVSVHGFDNIESSRFSTPSLSTMALPLFEMGYAAAKMIFDIFDEHQFTSKSVLVPCIHIPRESTKSKN